MHNLILLKTLLLSTSQRNQLKYCTDKKKKSRIIGNYIGIILFYMMIMAYCILMCIGYGMYQMIDAVPGLCALTISLLSFVFTIIKVNGYLFQFKEYDMLMALPLKEKTIAACKFAYMYIKSLPWYASIALSMMVGYGYFAKPAFYIYPIWVMLALVLPLIPMLVATFLGFLFAKISSGFRKRNLVQTILIMLLVLFCFGLRFFIDNMIRNDAVESTLQDTYHMTAKTVKLYPPAKWFEKAILQTDLVSLALLLVISVCLFAIVFVIIGSSYRNINSALKSHAAARKYRMTGQKSKKVVWTIAFKELKRMTGSTTYLVNVGLGYVLIILLGVIALFVRFDEMIAVLTNGAPFDPKVVYPSIPFIIYFFVGMVSTTACSPSLEGKNYWIVQSLPIEKKTLYQGKMLFQLCLSVPSMAIGTLGICISARIGIVDTICYLLIGFSLCLFSATWGCVCGVKHMRLDWENEVEVIKQGAAVSVYLLVNMFLTMAVAALSIFIGMQMDHLLLNLIWMGVYALLSVLCYLRVRVLTQRPKTA